MSGGQNQKWPTCGQMGYISPAIWGSLMLGWADGPYNPSPLGVLQTSKMEDKTSKGPQIADWPPNPCRVPDAGSRMQIYHCPPVGVPKFSERGTKLVVARKWAWLHNPCHVGGPQRFKVGHKERSSRQVGRVAT